MAKKIEISDFERDFCRTHGLPLPTVVGVERMRHLSVFRNRLHLYQGECAFTKKRGLTSIPPERGFIVYDVDIWNSDQWSALDYGRPYDFSRPFFEQFWELFKQVPLPNLSVNRPTMVNSDHTNGITGAKNCYLIFSASYNEDCMYCRLLLKCKDVVGTVFARECELCYGCSNIQNCYNLLVSSDCVHCSDSAFLANCRSCKNCYGCFNLANREYCFYNQQLSKEEFNRRRAEIDLGSYSVLERESQKFQQFSSSRPRKYLDGIQNENVSGAMISNSKNCHNCFSLSAGEDLESCWYVNGAKSSIAYFGYGNTSELVYSSVTVGDQSYNIKFSVECWPNVRDLEYCYYVGRGCHDCFGSVGLTRANHVILNQQYSPAEYRELLPRIKKHMISTGEYGQMFPKHFALHAYNKSEAIDWFPATREQALNWGFTWYEAEPDPKTTPQELPDHISESEKIDLKAAYRCEASGRLYRILKQELDFHQRINIALPRLNPFERLRLAGDFLAIKPLFPSQCSRCSASYVTSREIGQYEILCESCYEREISG